jgi:pilus assembly protein CpaB
MKAARLVVLTVANAAGGVAAMLAGRSEKPPEPKPDQQAKIDTVDVLVAAADIGMGHAVSPQDMQW